MLGTVCYACFDDFVAGCTFLIPIWGHSRMAWDSIAKETLRNDFCNDGVCFCPSCGVSMQTRRMLLAAGYVLVVTCPRGCGSDRLSQTDLAACFPGSKGKTKRTGDWSRLNKDP